MRVDASVFYDLSENVRISLAAKNLFDTDYIEAPVSNTEIYAGAPLTMLARLTAHYRSEEHTSELQSLMRISYAVFCLKKKNITPKQKTTHNIHKIKHTPTANLTNKPQK